MFVCEGEKMCTITWSLRCSRSSDMLALLLSVCLQLAFCTGEHQVAAASVPAAEGGTAGGPRCGPRPQARPGALL